jgi:hypothetical protein
MNAGEDALTAMSTQQSPILDVESAYPHFRRVFLRALAALARRGFAVPLEDGIDLIHDFFADEWSGLFTNFDPGKGAFEAYAYGAFVRFARPRIVKLRRWKASLLEPQSFESLGLRTDDQDRISLQIDAQLLASSIRRLPQEERELLTAYLNSVNHSERFIATKFSLSRYRLHEALINALSRVVVGFPKPASISDQDWLLAKAIWGEGRTLNEAAAILEMPLPEAKKSAGQFTLSMAEILRRFHDTGESIMTASLANRFPNRSPIQLLCDTLASPQDEALLSELQAHAAEVLSALESDESMKLPEVSEQNQDWVARVYEALSLEPEVSMTPEQAASEKVLFETRKGNLEDIGKAFRETLLPDLPMDLVRFSRFFSEAPRATSEEVSLLSRDPDVQAAVPNSIDLAIFGIRPLTIFHASEAVSALLDRLLRYELINTSDLVLSGQSEDYAQRIFRRVPDISIPAEIAKITLCHPKTARLLLKWLLRVAEYKPCVFGGFEAEPKENGVILRPSSRQIGNLFERWSVMYA